VLEAFLAPKEEEDAIPVASVIFALSTFARFTCCVATNVCYWNKKRCREPLLLCPNSGSVAIHDRQIIFGRGRDGAAVTTHHGRRFVDVKEYFS
jgi:hypothetical protein